MRRRYFRALLFITYTVLLAASCDSDEPAPKAKSIPAPPAPELPPTPAREVTFPTADAAHVSGTLYLARDQSAPAVLLVHRFRGSRRELAGLADRLARAERRYTILNLDLRGHGQSIGGDGGVHSFAELKPQELPNLQADILAALDFVRDETDAKLRSVIIVGDGLGGTLAALAAAQRPNIAGLALISPGRKLEGVDLYEAYLPVRRLPLFLARSSSDNVSSVPADDLSRMARAPVTVKTYAQAGRGARLLTMAGAPLFVDLESWLMSLYDVTPPERPVPKAGPSAG
jgi:pimeloyl-ACP methyl ester carboxylesterase